MAAKAYSRWYQFDEWVLNAIRRKGLSLAEAEAYTRTKIAGGHLEVEPPLPFFRFRVLDERLRLETRDGMPYASTYRCRVRYGEPFIGLTPETALPAHAKTGSDDAKPVPGPSVAMSDAVKALAATRLRELGGAHVVSAGASGFMLDLPAKPAPEVSSAGGVKSGAEVDRGGREPEHDWEGAAGYVDGKKPLALKADGAPNKQGAIDLMREWFDKNDPPAPDGKSIRRWLNKAKNQSRIAGWWSAK